MASSCSSAANLAPENFKIMPIKFREKSKSQHYLFYKEHRVRGTHESKPLERTLFVVNVPPYCNEDCMRRLFGDCGEVQHVWFHNKPNSGEPHVDTSMYFPTLKPVKGFKVAYVVFTESDALKKALSLNVNAPRILWTSENPLIVGIKKWRVEYNKSIPDPKALNDEIQSYMEEYDRRMEEEKARAKAMDGVPDEEGWITVTRHGRRPVIPRTETVDKKLMEKEKKKRAKKELLNFYTFQIRESKMQHLAELRKKFEEDKQRIAIMKASRKFKPY